MEKEVYIVGAEGRLGDGIYAIIKNKTTGEVIFEKKCDSHAEANATANEEWNRIHNF
jgi:dihydrodipicolinate reductase